MLKQQSKVNIFSIPKGILTVVSGVAGSCKSSLIRNKFVSIYPASIVIDQKPIGISSQSTPATYTGIMDEICKGKWYWFRVV